MSLPQWKGLFDWSMKYQDGTRLSNWDPKDYDAAKMKWLEDVLKNYMQDFAARMKEIKEGLQSGLAAAAEQEGQGSAAAEAGEAAPTPSGSKRPVSVAEMSALLEELMDIVSSIDFARDLHKVGGLPTLLDLLDYSAQPGLRWRAAEVVATCMANNPPVQQWFLEGGVFPRLMNLVKATGVQEDEVLVRVKGLLALSALIRHHQPGQQVFRGAQGPALLAGLAADPDTRVSKKAMSLLQYCCSLSTADAASAVAAGCLQPAIQLLSGPQAVASVREGDVGASDTRTAALALLCELAGCGGATWEAVKSSEGLMPAIQALQAAISGLSGEDAESFEDEASAIRQLTEQLSQTAAPPVRADRVDHVPLGNEEDEHGPRTVPLHAGSEAPTAAPAATTSQAQQQAPLLLGAP